MKTAFCSCVYLMLFGVLCATCMRVNAQPSYADNLNRLLEKRDTSRIQQLVEETSGEQQGHMLTDLGYIALNANDSRLAIHFFEQALSRYGATTNYEQLAAIYRGLVSSCKATGNYQKALEYETKTEICNDSLNEIAQRGKLDELRNRYDKNFAETELLRLRAEKEKNFIIIMLLGLLVFLAAFMVLLIIRKQQYRLKIAEMHRRELQVILKTKSEIEKNLKAELEFKAKELTSFTLGMIQKKEILETIRSAVEDVKTKTEGEPRMQLNRILTTINFSQRLDQDWENFKLYFEHVHHGFFDNLRSIYPELNSNDLRLCALIRLNLDTKQIASVMDIAPESAKVAKHRIRKKLRLSNAENLHTFFSRIAPLNNNGEALEGLIKEIKQHDEEL